MNASTTSVFEKTNERFGFPESFQTFSAKSLPSGPVVFSTDPVASSVTPKLITVSSIKELKKLVGEPDPTNDIHLPTPPRYYGQHDEVLASARSRKQLALQIDGDTKNEVRQAAEHYLLGNSQMVSPYEPMIDKLVMPVTLAYFSTNDPVVIDRLFTVTGHGVVVLNFQSITFKSAGQLNVRVECNLNCDVLARES